MTKTELKNLERQFENVKKGYCCYQDDNKSKYTLIEVGSNYGVYGWNWTAYIDLETETLYISGYRNY